MTEEQLIAKIKELQDIKPRQDWVFLTKERILGKEQKDPSYINMFRFAFSHKLVASSLVGVFVLFGVFSFSQVTTPGDNLFFIKKATENTWAMLNSKDKKAELKVGQAQKRLDDLVKIAEENDTKKLASAINEYQESISDVASALAKQKNDSKVEEIIKEVQKLEEQEELVKSFAIEIDRNIDLDYYLVQTIINRVKELETKTLTEEQMELLNEVNKYVEEGDFESALIKSLELTE